MSNWQLIKSAPEDGTAVLAYGPTMEPNIYVLRFEELEMDDHDALGNVVRRVFWVGWREAGGEGHERFEPTLWMPLDPLIASAMLVDANERKPE